MRRVVTAVFLSTDGVMQAPGGPEEDPTGGFRHGGWVVPYFDEAVGEAIGEIFARPFDLLLGRRTYEIFAAHWPYAEDGPDADIARALNGARKYVATSSRAPLAWNNSVAIHAPVADVGRLKGEDGPDLLIQGSSVLTRSLLAEGLVDEFNLLVFPVVLGTGKRFFGEDARAEALKLERSRTTPSGVVIGRYVPAGPVQAGSFALETPTEEEAARRQKMKLEA